MKQKKREITQGPRSLSPAPVVRISQPRRWNVGIQDWKQAITSAENVDYPMRARLLDIYSDMMLDAHLAAVIEKRKSNVTSAPITFVRPDGTTDDRVSEMIAAPWFDRFLKDAIDSKFWGFSLFQFDTDRDGWPTCRMIRRKHVDPVRRLILREQYDQTGDPFDDFYSLLLVGDPDDLGLLAKAARYVIYKNNDLGDWTEFAEIFGMPIREYTYDATDDDSRQRLLQDAHSQGAAQVYIHPEGTSLNLVESGGKSGSLDVYRGLADFCNAEISKLFLGNTLTTEASDTGTQALGSVQKKGEDIILREDRKFILNILNYQLSDILTELGLDTRQGRFQYEETEDDDTEKQLRIVQGLYAMGLDIDHDYLFEKFGVRKAEKNASEGQTSPEKGKDAQVTHPDGKGGNSTPTERNDGNGSESGGEGGDGEGGGKPGEAPDGGENAPEGEISPEKEEDEEVTRPSGKSENPTPTRRKTGNGERKGGGKLADTGCGASPAPEAGGKPGEDPDGGENAPRGEISPENEKGEQVTRPSGKGGKSTPTGRKTGNGGDEGERQLSFFRRFFAEGAKRR